MHEKSLARVPVSKEISGVRSPKLAPSPPLLTPLPRLSAAIANDVDIDRRVATQLHVLLQEGLIG